MASSAVMDADTLVREIRRGGWTRAGGWSRIVIEAVRLESVAQPASLQA